MESVCACMKVESGNHEALQRGLDTRIPLQKHPKAIKFKRFQLMSCMSGLAEEETSSV